ncbi:carbohydrate esterase family 9 protein [Baudoinia panamericana UAMH 10762]|uniref:N-acetylglucosamine-6-phosphate deacetylase n=1 Tax=Baudoinia panamericana (strain UAMH 10762) TaxID=717646 RepID=M2MEP2_BAUPA|nr:carbohydrate esterase family 9 protein [Baudoinia panamericana UAMH 10762]EMC95036.1 carbohydrate esterase family 9 protein [Baudoinia panamericana UAMH 10762]
MTIITIQNARLCHHGQLIDCPQLFIDDENGTVIVHNVASSDNTINLHGGIVAAGFLELQTNGLRGFHFTHLHDEAEYKSKIDEVAQYLPSTGVTGFYATIPTVHGDEFKKILPSLMPRLIDGGASLLGAHAEGPYLHSSKKGAHNASLFHQPSTPPPAVYGDVANSNNTLKLVTLAPELDGTADLVRTLTSNGTKVSLGHSSASYSQGLAAIRAGATCLTHTLNAMAPLHHRDPGLAGLVNADAADLAAFQSPYFSIIPDGNHLHPGVATMLFRSNPSKCIVITDSIELAGLPDGTYPGHAQIPFNQTKKGSRVVIEGTDTLIGGCAGLDECVRNVMKWSGCGIAEAVRCVTENVADFMGDESRGSLDPGKRADFVVLDESANVLQTWVGGKKVWAKQ